MTCIFFIGIDHTNILANKMHKNSGGLLCIDQQDQLQQGFPSREEPTIKMSQY